MGQKLLSYYDEAKKLGGLKGQIRMAVITRLSSTKAANAPDSQENITKFDQAMSELKKEFRLHHPKQTRNARI